MAEPPISQLERKRRRTVIAIALLRALLTVAVLVALYYILPLGERWRLSAGLRVLAGLAAFVAVLTWQIRTVLRSKHPGIRAMEALALTVPLFLLLFAATYFLLSANGSANFSQEHLSRTDALYFTVTTFATVGYGDISATSQTARVVVMSQMLLDLLILGIGINAFVKAARVGRQRQSANDDGAVSP
jgi:voltage-gated potassium channel Kch